MTCLETTSGNAVFLPALRVPAPADPFVIDTERDHDVAAREALLDACFGPARFAKTCERLRAGRRPADGLALTARVGGRGDAAASEELVGTVRLWHVSAGGVPALMLGPLAVDARWRCFGVGARLMEAALSRAEALGHQAILLVGDAPYYARFGFSRARTLALRMPGPVEADRFLGLELVPGALAKGAGVVAPTGVLDLAARRAPHRTHFRRVA